MQTFRRYLILLALTLMFSFLAYQVPVTLRVDVGSPDDAKAVEGFYFAETNGDVTYRWSGPAGKIGFDGAGVRPWTLILRASGLRPVGPARVADSWLRLIQSYKLYGMLLLWLLLLWVGNRPAADSATTQAVPARSPGAPSGA